MEQKLRLIRLIERLLQFEILPEKIAEYKAQIAKLKAQIEANNEL